LSPGVRAAVARIRSRLDRLAGSAIFAYGSILLIQSKLLWGIWQYRDLTSGDTTAYFVFASRWAESFDLDLVHYPLYTAAWGSLRWLISDPYAVTIVHRVLIAIAASLLVLAVLRRLLSPGIAWAVAVWWVILPINYDNLYELHLFALLPGLAAVLVALHWRGLWMRSVVFALLLAGTLFLRAETVFALLVWTAAWVAYEVREARRGAATPVRELWRAVGVPVLVVALLAAAVLASDPGRDGVIERFRGRESTNVCENYAFGYEQRHDDYKRSPFAGCGPLSLREFGDETPSLIGAIKANPGAMREHFLWNARLVPYGLELMLFDRISAGPDRNPDYVEIKTGSKASLVGLTCLTVFVACGLLLLWRGRLRWWETEVRERAWGWLALCSLALTAAIVMIWQRPRPSYLFALSVLILAVVGMSAMACVDRWPRLARLRFTLPLLAVLLLLIVPPHFGPDYQTPQIGRPGRPMKAMLDRLYQFRSQIRGERSRLLATYSAPVCRYLGGDKPCKAVTWKAIVHRPAKTSLRSALDARAVDFIYADEADFHDPSLRTALTDPEVQDWQHLAPPGAGWLLLRRTQGPVGGWLRERASR
jgi:hypothetical protein